MLAGLLFVPCTHAVFGGRVTLDMLLCLMVGGLMPQVTFFCRNSVDSPMVLCFFYGTWHLSPNYDGLLKDNNTNTA